MTALHSQRDSGEGTPSRISGATHRSRELRFTSDSGHRFSSHRTDVSPTRGERFIPSKSCFWLPEADRGVYHSVKITSSTSEPWMTTISFAHSPSREDGSLL